MNRFVIAKPHRDFPLLPTDQLYAMVPFKDLYCKKMSVPVEKEHVPCVTKKVVPSENVFRRFKLKHSTLTQWSKEKKQESKKSTEI